jgi:hypothetical protein
MVRLLTGATEGVDIALVNITPMTIIVNIWGNVQNYKHH